MFFFCFTKKIGDEVWEALTYLDENKYYKTNLSYELQYSKGCPISHITWSCVNLYNRWAFSFPYQVVCS